MDIERRETANKIVIHFEVTHSAFDLCPLALTQFTCSGVCVCLCDWLCSVRQVKVLYSIPPLFLRPCVASIHGHAGVRADQRSTAAALSSVWPAVCIWLGSKFTSVSPSFLFLSFPFSFTSPFCRAVSCQTAGIRVLNTRLSRSSGGRLRLSNASPVINKSLKMNYILTCFRKSKLAKLSIWSSWRHMEVMMVEHKPRTLSEMQRCQTLHKQQIASSCSLQFSACLGSEFAEGRAVCSLLVARLLFILDHSLG